MENDYKNGILFVWEIYPSHSKKKKKCDSCIGRCDKRERVFHWKDSKEYDLKKGEEMKPYWQNINMGRECFRKSTVQDRCAKS